MARLRSLALLGTAGIAFAACSGDVDTAIDSAPLTSATDSTLAAPDAPPDPAPETTTSIATPSTNAPPSTRVQGDPTAIDFGPGKPDRYYDDFLLAAATDLEQWWSEQYPVLYGEPFEPLAGGIIAAYPDRPGDIPGCGAPSTSYDDVAQYVAFYCADGDFITYDDGDDSLLVELAVAEGAAAIATVLAHEYTHAVQFRSGGLSRGLASIVTEQQADCFAGAWTARAADGDSPVVEFGDGDVRSGLIAMTQVSDPVGIDQFTLGSHGSAFDRVGAFQVGFLEGPARCAELLDAPLPLMPNEFADTAEQSSGGDAPYGYGDDEVIGFLMEDLNRYWGEELADRIPGFAPLSVVVADLDDELVCDDLRGDLGSGVALCAASGEVYVNEPAAQELYRSTGDFAIGYLLADRWSEAALIALGSDLTGAERALLNDCLTGGWAKTITPIDFVLPEPRLASRDSTRLSAGDLDEAIQTVLMIADPSGDDDRLGTVFAKVDAFRTGVISGTDACLDDR